MAATKIMVCRGWGKDEPGIAEAFMRVVADSKCQVQDIAQFVMEGSLMFTFVIEVPDSILAGLKEKLTSCASQKKLQLDFYCPDADGKVGLTEHPPETIAVLSIVSRKEITPALLSGVDELLCQQGCIIREVEHRNDNKLELNGEVNKVEIRIWTPPRFKLSSLLIRPGGNGHSEGLQELVWQHGAEMSLRWCSAMNRPNGKSLVVFGISQELVTCNPLDEVLKAAGVEASAVAAAAAANSGAPERQSEAKVALLKGRSADAIQKVIDGLEFTPGAILLCSALKRLGCRLAILTNLGIKKIAEHVQRELGMDYAMCRDLEVVDGKFTGKFTGDLSEVRFRKADLLTLMADREAIDYRNVVLFGESVSQMKSKLVREVVDNFGPCMHFHASTAKDLTIALYLLGFNGSDVRALRRKRQREEDDDPVVKQLGKRFQVQVSAKRRQPGQVRDILKPLSASGSEVKMGTVSMCTLQDGGLCMGLDLQMQKDPDAVMKELLASCQEKGFQVLSSGPAMSAPSPKEALAVFRRRYVITVVQQPKITSESLANIFGLFSKHSVNVVRVERLVVNEPAALQFTVTTPEGLDMEKISKELVDASKDFGIDIAFQKDDVERWMRRLVVFDMDSTLIQQEVIDELAKYAGVETEVKTITEAAMRGELNFFESLKARVALLKGYDAEELFSKVKVQLEFTPGAKKLCDTLKQLGFKMAVISGGFLPLAREVQRYLGLDYAFANTLEVDENGKLTGRTSGPVVTPQRKRALLATIADVEGCDMAQTIAVGDGANDIPMLNAAGLGIAFCAKPKVQAATEFRINQKDLSTVLFLIGVSEQASTRLTTDRPFLEGSPRASRPLTSSFGIPAV